MTKEEMKKLSAVIVILKKLEDAEEYLSLENLKEGLDLKDTYVKNIINKLKDMKMLGSSSGNKGGYFLMETIKDLKFKEILKIAFNEE